MAREPIYSFLETIRARQRYVMGVMCQQAAFGHPRDSYLAFSLCSLRYVYTVEDLSEND